MIALTDPINPVRPGGYGDEHISLRGLRDFCDITNRNMQHLANAHNTLDAKDRQRYDKAIAFVEWLATTNPKVLDEFQAVAKTVDSLEPGDDGGEAQAYAAP